MLQTQRAHETEKDSERHRDREGKQENSDTVEQGRQIDVFAMELRKSPVVVQEQNQLNRRTHSPGRTHGILTRT